MSWLYLFRQVAVPWAGNSLRRAQFAAGWASLLKDRMGEGYGGSALT